MSNPLRMADERQFERVRNVLAAGGFTEHELLAYVGDHDEMTPFPDGLVPSGAPPIGLLIGLFLRRGATTREQFVTTLGAAALVDFQTLGMLESAGDSIRATVRMRPMA